MDKQHKHKEEGQGLVEYALILVLVAVVIIIILTILGTSVGLVYVRVIGGLNGQSITGSGTEYVVLNADVTVTGGTVCNVSITNASVAVIENGALLQNGSSGAITVSAPGGSTTMSGGTNNMGIVSGLSATLSGVTCGGNLTIGNTGFSKPITP